MFTIGEVSRITQLSIKALRLYHEKSILVPASTDRFTGYRHYDERSLEKARVIKALRELDFSLDDIAAMVSGFEDEADILQFLQHKQDAIQTRVKDLKRIKQQLNLIITKEKEFSMTIQQSEFVIEEKELAPLLIAGIRYKGAYSDCGKYFGKIARHFGRHIAGAAMDLYYDSDYKAEDADIETCYPVREAKSAEGVTVHELPAGKCISLIHHGTYDSIGATYQKLSEYAAAKGYSLETPTRQIYLKGPGMIFRGDPKNYLTEVQMVLKA